MALVAAADKSRRHRSCESAEFMLEFAALEASRNEVAIYGKYDLNGDDAG